MRTPSQLMLESRIAMKMSQKALGDHLGISNQSISNIERGLTTPTVARIHAICKVLRISPTDMARAFGDREYSRILEAIEKQKAHHNNGSK